MPDGEEMDGVTDENGLVRFDNVLPGEYTYRIVDENDETEIVDAEDENNNLIK